ncbi:MULTISPECIES: hypothetical protein [unclassified Chryseobacterium]|uniref:hypothetical protein n=1 Tax=unclassified Chryseobacterium TaxID=2593645 RepID=UPI0012F8E8FA|nr:MULTISPECIES: hypothetical protein [unclassified Chryseobacterium]
MILLYEQPKFNIRKIKKTDSNYYKFVNPSNEKDFLTVVFERSFEGWNILNLHGSYDSLFKIWKNRFDRSANAENIRYKGFATKGRTRFEKNTENDCWKISFIVKKFIFYHA